jgi:hypothetical protein
MVGREKESVNGLGLMGVVMCEGRERHQVRQPRTVELNGATIRRLSLLLLSIRANGLDYGNRDGLLELEIKLRFGRNLYLLSAC